MCPLSLSFLSREVPLQAPPLTEYVLKEQRNPALSQCCRQMAEQSSSARGALPRDKKLFRPPHCVCMGERESRHESLKLRADVNPGSPSAMLPHLVKMGRNAVSQLLPNTCLKLCLTPTWVTTIGGWSGENGLRLQRRSKDQISEKPDCQQ